MKHVVSVSLGSSKRDKSVRTDFLGESFLIERIGTDGSFERFAELFREFDGKADALCMGGIDIYLYSGGRRYAFRDALKLAANASKSPVVDGSGLKNTLERQTVEYLLNEGVMDFTETKILMVCGVDRFGMAESLVNTGANVVFGDLMFSLGLPIPITSWRMLRLVAALLLPVIVKLPFAWYYPTGEKQNEIEPKYEEWYDWADVIAGDFLIIRRHLPEMLEGKCILTNTTTSEDVEELRKRRVRRLITSTPEFEGRSFGTNVMEGVVVSLLGRRPEEITPEEYMGMLNRLGWKPRILELEAG